MTGLAIVTGAARNIGRAIALALAGDVAAVLLVAKRDRAGLGETAKLVDAAGGAALPQPADLTDEAAAAGMVEAALAWNGPPVVLVNNAAPREPPAFCEMTLADWREIMAINLKAAFLCARACLPQMIAAGGGRIVDIGGKSGHAGASERARVIASKAGLVGLTKARVVAPLCRPDAGYVTGQTIHVNGGGYLP